MTNFKVLCLAAALAAPALAAVEPSYVLSREEIRAAIQRILERDQKLHGGYFLIWDAKAQHTWRLKHQSVHERVAWMDSPVARRMLAEHGLTPQSREEEIVYFGCNNFLSTEGTLVDVDVWMARSGDKLAPLQMMIHKVSGKPRYTFRNDEIVPADE